jgi:hypothetical protein
MRTPQLVGGVPPGIRLPKHLSVENRLSTALRKFIPSSVSVILRPKAEESRRTSKKRLVAHKPLSCELSRLARQIFGFIQNVAQVFKSRE